MIEDAPDDFSPDALSLVGLIDDHIPNSRAIDEIGEDTAEADQLITVPGTEGHISMLQHGFGIVGGSILRPRRLMEQPKKLRDFGWIAMGVGDGGLEGWRHLILEYPPNWLGVYEETDVNASPNLPKVLPPHVAEKG